MCTKHFLLLLFKKTLISIRKKMSSHQPKWASPACFDKTVSQQELGWVAPAQMKIAFFNWTFIAWSYNPFCVYLGQLSVAAILN